MPVYSVFLCLLIKRPFIFTFNVFQKESLSEMGVTAGTEASDIDTSSEVFSSKEIQDLSQAVSSLKPVLEEEREVLREIQEDREEYREVRKGDKNEFVELHETRMNL